MFVDTIGNQLSIQELTELCALYALIELYNTFVRPSFGKKRIQTLKKSDVKIFYNYLADQRCLQASTIDSIHTVLHQVLDMAVDDKYIRNNPSDKALKELKQSHAFKTEKRRALTIAESLDNYLKKTV